MTLAISTTIYCLDREQRITSVSGPWDQFARENGGPDVLAGRVCGRSIWDFVNGDATRMWLNALFQLAFVRNEMVERPYRCDSPDFKRFMRMQIFPETGGVLRVEHELLSLEKRIRPVYICHESTIKAPIIHLRCSICGRVKIGGVWEEPGQRHCKSSGSIVVAYSVCDDCMQPLH